MMKIKLSLNTEIFAAVFLISFTTYVITLCPTVYVGDSGELIASIHTLGIAHPPGYPLYVLLGKLFTLIIPFGTIAFRVNLFSAFCASIATAVFYLVFIMLHLRKTVAIAVSFLWAFSSFIWSQATVARVYSLSVLITVICVCFLFSWIETKKRTYVFLFFLISGLGLANHIQISAVLLSGIIVFIIWEQGFMKKCTLLLSALPFLIPGSLLYLYIPLRAMMNPPVNWENPDTLGKFIKFITRANYWHKSFVENWTDAVAVVKHYLSILPEQLTWVGITLLILGIIACVLKKKKKLLVFSLSVFLLNILLMIFHGSRSDIWYWPRYTTVGFTGLFLIIAYGLNFLISNIKKRVVSVILVISIPFYVFAVNFNSNNKSKNFIAYDYNKGILDFLPQNAILVAQGDNVLFPLMYLHIVEGMRPDIKLVMQGVEDLSSMKINPDKEDIFFTHYNDLKTPHAKLVPEGLIYRFIRADAKWEPVLPWDKLTVRGMYDSSVYKDYLCRNLIADYLIMKGINYEKIDTQKAREYFRKAGKIDYNNDVCHYNLGLAYMRNGWEDDAMREFQKSAKINPKNYQAGLRVDDYKARDLLEQASISFKNGNIHQAERELLEAVKIAPYSLRAHKNLGALYIVKGNFHKARKEYKIALKLKPDDQEIKINLKNIERKLKFSP